MTGGREQLSQERITQVKDILTQCFNISELQDMIFGVDYDFSQKINPTWGIDEIARRIVDHFIETGHFESLIGEIRRLRPRLVF